ncbi:MAG: M16 family metallopeptidase [Paracoccaceae bacterium]
MVALRKRSPNAPALHTVILALGALILSTVLTSMSARAEPPVTTFTLDNGMDVVVIEDNRAPVVTHMVWYRGGAADEPRGVSGIAHFLEHLMFKGTDEIPDGAFSKIIAANGGQDNAFTAQDYTGYFQRIASDRLELVMKMEADRMVDVVITEDHVRTEREVIIEERNSRTDNSPDALFSEQMRAALFLNHAYGVPIIGWRHEMEELSLADALEFYERYYAPDNAILVVAGDVTPERVRDLAETYYGPLKPSGNPPDARPQEPPQIAPRRISMSDPRVRQDYVMRSYLVPEYDPEAPKTSAALMLFSSVLGDGVASRLSKSLQLEQKIAISSGAWYSPRSRDSTSLTVYGVPAPGSSLEDVEAAIDAIIADLAETGPTEEELTRVKRVLRANRVFMQDSQSSLARFYGAALAIGLSVEDVLGWPAVVESETIEDIRAAAQKYLDMDQSVTGYLMRGEAS